MRTSCNRQLALLPPLRNPGLICGPSIKVTCPNLDQSRKISPNLDLLMIRTNFVSKKGGGVLSDSRLKTSLKLRLLVSIRLMIELGLCQQPPTPSSPLYWDQTLQTKHAGQSKSSMQNHINNELRYTHASSYRCSPYHNRG